MKLRHQLYLFFAVLAGVLLASQLLSYAAYRAHFFNDLETYAQSEAALHKKEVLASVESAYRRIIKQQERFQTIHDAALQALKARPEKDLAQLKKELKADYLPEHIEVELFLIDRSYTIYRTTFPKDLGLNLSVISEAKLFLDKTSVDGKIYAPTFPSTDPLDLSYKFYTYSRLDDGRYLELGFIDTSLENSLAPLLVSDGRTKTGITLFCVVKTGTDHYYYSLKNRENISSKEAHFRSLTSFPEGVPTTDVVMNTFWKGQPLHLPEGKVYTIYAPLFEEDMFQTLGFNNLVLKVDVDVSEKVAFFQQYNRIFFASLIVIVALLLFLLLMIRRRFTRPVETILSCLTGSKKVEEKELLRGQNELARIAQQYNRLFDSLQGEIVKNRQMLSENKRFIADTVHQIRTPLANIMMNNDLIKLYTKETSVRNFLDQIDASISMLNNSYEDLAYVTTYDTMEYTPADVSVDQILRERVRFFETIARVNDKHLKPEVEIAARFMINPIELERIIDNNIANGIKYGAPGQPVTIRLVKSRGKLLLQFATFGPPIAKPNRVFDKNYRENHGKRGLGLGLFMVKGICEKYGIGYKVSYEAGQNRFVYRFPHRPQKIT